MDKTDYTQQMEKPPRHPESAKSHMVTRISRARAEENVNTVIERLKDPRTVYDTVDYTYVTDEDGVLKGIVSMKEMLNSRPQQKIGKLMTQRFTVAHPSTDQERVAQMALNHNIKTVPVVDKSRKLLGVVPSDVIMNILHWEHTEDMLRLSGVHGKNVDFRSLMGKGVLKMSRARIPSLLIGVLGGLLATVVMQRYEVSLQENILIAFFVPIMLYICAAVGTQTGTILVRTLAFGRVKIGAYVLREIAVGLIIAGLLAGVVFGAVWFWFGVPLVAVTVALSLFAGVLTAVLLGIMIPWLLSIIHQDPAISGGPFITITQDVLTLLIYFAVAEMILL